MDGGIILEHIGDIDKLYKDEGILDDIDQAIKALSYHEGSNPLDIDKLNTIAKTGVIYLDNERVPLEGDESYTKEKAYYKIIPTYIKDKYTGKQLCVSFYKQFDEWHGIFSGTLLKLLSITRDDVKQSKASISKIKKFNTDIILKGRSLDEIKCNNRELGHISFSKYLETADYAMIVGETKEEINVNNEEDETYLRLACNAYLDDIYSSLLMKESWGEGSRLLQNYIHNIKLKVINDMSANDFKDTRGNGYVLNEQRTMAIVNTGLIDTYCNDIYIQCKVDRNKEYTHLSRDSIMACKSKLITFGFNRADIIALPQPIKFYNDKSQLIFNASIDDFDFSDTQRFNHIIQERRGRFPEKYQSMPDDVLAEKLVSGVKRAVKISARDYKYIVPMYNPKMDILQFLLPLYMDNSIDDIPELALVVGEYNGFYIICTALDLDSAYTDARLISPPDNNWLSKRR